MCIVSELVMIMSKCQVFYKKKISYAFFNDRPPNCTKIKWTDSNYSNCLVSLHWVNESYDWLLFRKKKWIEINLSYMYALLWIGKNHFELSLHLTLYQKPWKSTENSVHLYFITCIHIWFYKIVFISAADKHEYYINVHRSLDQNKKMYVEFFKNKKNPHD